MEKPMEVIKSFVYDPRGGVIFKNNKTKDVAFLHTISCSNKENCQLYAKGQCALLNVFMLSAGYKCPYGKRTRQSSPSQRAKGFSDWVANAKKGCVDNPITEATKKMAIVGDYIFLPYPHIGGFWENNDSIGFAHGFMTMENFKMHAAALFRMRPRAMMGGEIVSYQREVVPMMATHLNELMPEMVKADPYIEALLPKSAIGRMAVLKSLKPGTVIQDDKGREWNWDGELLHSANWPSYAIPFNVKVAEAISIRPPQGLCIKITSDSQVDSDTEFDV